MTTWNDIYQNIQHVICINPKVTHVYTYRDKTYTVTCNNFSKTNGCHINIKTPTGEHVFELVDGKAKFISSTDTESVPYEISKLILKPKELEQYNVFLYNMYATELPGEIEEHSDGQLTFYYNISNIDTLLKQTIEFYSKTKICDFMSSIQENFDKWYNYLSKQPDNECIRSTIIDDKELFVHLFSDIPNGNEILIGLSDNESSCIIGGHIKKNEYCAYFASEVFEYKF